MKNLALALIVGGALWMASIPARDLTTADVERFVDSARELYDRAVVGIRRTKARIDLAMCNPGRAHWGQFHCWICLGLGNGLLVPRG